VRISDFLDKKNRRKKFPCVGFFSQKIETLTRRIFPLLFGQKIQKSEQENFFLFFKPKN